MAKSKFSGKKPRAKKPRKSSGNNKRSNAWRAYTSGGRSNAPIPD